MNLGTWLEVALGLATLYFLLATACSTLLEAIQSWHGTRGRALSVFIEEMLTGARSPRRLFWVTKLVSFLKALYQPQRSLQTGGTAVDWLLKHPLIESLRKPDVRLSGKDTAPSYIPTKLISQVMLSELARRYGPLSVLLTPEVKEQLARWAKGMQPGPAEPLARVVESWCNGPASAMVGASALLDALLPVGSESWSSEQFKAAADLLEPQLGKLPASPLKTVLAHALQSLRALAESGSKFPTRQAAIDTWLANVVERLPVVELSYELVHSIVVSGVLNPNLQRSLQSVLDVANLDLDKVRSGIEQWYDSVMDRATGWFKRRAMLWLFLMALLAAVTLNLNSFDIAGQLLEKPALRQRASTLAETLTKTAPERLGVLTQQTGFVSWLQSEGLDGDDHTSITKPQARKALVLLLRSPEFVGPVLQLVANLQDVNNGELDRELIERIAALSCRGRLGRIPRDLISDEVRKLAALNDAELLPPKESPPKESFCNEEIAVRDAALIDREKNACSLVGLGGVTWNPLAAELSCKLLTNKKADPDAEKTTRQAYRDAAAGAEQLVTDVRAAYNLLDRVGLIWKVWRHIWFVPPEPPTFKGQPDTAKVCPANPPMKGCEYDKGFRFLKFLSSAAGWLLTALMVSFGAPFWFDLLSKLVDRRGAGPKTPEA